MNHFLKATCLLVVTYVIFLTSEQNLCVCVSECMCVKYDVLILNILIDNWKILWGNI